MPKRDQSRVESVHEGAEGKEFEGTGIFSDGEGGHEPPIREDKVLVRGQPRTDRNMIENARGKAMIRAPVTRSSATLGRRLPSSCRHRTCLACQWRMTSASGHSVRLLQQSGGR